MSDGQHGPGERPPAEVTAPEFAALFASVNRLTTPDGLAASPGDVHFVKDYVGADYHNDGHTHIDALCHVAYKGSLYNGRPEAAVTPDGATVDSIEVLENGLVGRGVLLDIPQLRGVPWLEPGEHIFRADLEQAERRQGVRTGEGDMVLVGTGHARRLAERGPWNPAELKAGLHPTAITFLAERGVAALGSDGNSDTAPSTTEGIEFPIHVLALTAMGVHLLDYLQLEDCTPAASIATAGSSCSWPRRSGSSAAPDRR
jgi:kynurenine formamidase